MSLFLADTCKTVSVFVCLNTLGFFSSQIPQMSPCVYFQAVTVLGYKEHAQHTGHGLRWNHLESGFAPCQSQASVPFFPHCLQRQATNQNISSTSFMFFVHHSSGDTSDPISMPSLSMSQGGQASVQAWIPSADTEVFAVTCRVRGGHKCILQ